MNILIFEFFSGIGGIHEAFNMAELTEDKNFLPYDVNLNANDTYYKNFNITPNSKTLERMTINDYESICLLEKHNCISWLMSPPCQPYTRIGKQKDTSDDRSKALLNLFENIFTYSKYKPDHLFIENVEGFEVT